MKTLKGHFSKKTVDGYACLQSLLEICSNSNVCSIALLSREMSGNLPRDNDGTAHAELFRGSTGGYGTMPGDNLLGFGVSALSSPRGYFGQGSKNSSNVDSLSSKINVVLPISFCTSISSSLKKK